MPRTGSANIEKYNAQVNEYSRDTVSNGGNNGGKNTKKKKTPLFFKILFVIYLVVSVLFFGYVAKLNMLPAMYLSIIAGLDFVITGLICLGMVRKHKKLTKNIVCTILAIIIMAGYAFAFKYLHATMSFIGTMSEEVEQTEDYYIVTLNNGKLNELNDINGKNLHVFSTADDYDDVKADISSKVNVYFKEDTSLQTLAEDILSWKSYVALVSASQYEMIKDDISDFPDKTKIIYTTTHKIKNADTSEINDENSDLSIQNGTFNVYISGIDTSGKISNVSRSDANILATVNTKTKTVLLTSIPRDYYVTLHSKQAKDKLTHSGIYGVKETVTTIEDLFDTDINYYVRVNFTTLIKLVDTLGGVDVNSDYAFTAQGYSFVKGTNHLNGQKALAFSRERHSFAEGDRQRVKNQQHVMEAIMKKVLNSTTILTKYTSILNSLSGSFQTNIEQSDISKLVKGQLNDMSGWNFQSTSVDGTGASQTTYSAGSQKLYVMIPNVSTVEAAKAKINSVLGK